MESRDYQELAPKTATLDHQQVLGRVNDRAITLLHILGDVIEACGALERAKKHFLYGKAADAPASAGDIQLGGLGPDVQDRLLACFDLLHGAIGMATESGELLEQVRSHIFHLKDLDTTNVLEELGDISWYMALAAKGNGTPFEQVWAANIAKLKKRYPAGVFDEKFAHNRDVAAERRAIEVVKLPAGEQPEFWKDVDDQAPYALPRSRAEYLRWCQIFELTGKPGFVWVGDGYALFDINHFASPDDLPLGFYWVDYQRLPEGPYEKVRAKMKDRSRYHVGHMPSTPGPDYKVPGVSRVCACSSCMPPVQPEAA